MSRYLTCLALVGALVAPSLLSAQHEQHAATPQQGGARLMDDLGSHSMRISTRVPMAQRFFDQGLRLAYAFNHDEARRSFEEAARLDPQCAMCQWGIAYVLGPNINLPMQPEAEEPARQAAAQALALAANATPREQAYIRAMAARYGVTAQGVMPASRAALDSAYVRAMLDVARQYPDDADAAALAAEAMMDLRPWEYWRGPDDPYPGTTELVALLEGALRLQPDNPGACHFYIHAVEAYHADRAVACAERLAALMPGAGHLVHMPGHIYIRVGRWEDAIRANEHAVHADEQYLNEFGAMGFYPIGYYPHNYHFLSFAAMMLGREEQAVEAARMTAAKIPPAVAAQEPSLQFLTPFPHLVLSSFERWDAVLAEPLPPADQVVGRGLAQYARGRAFAATGKAADARAALDSVRAAHTATGAEPMRTALAIATHVLASDVALLAGDTTTAIAELERAVALEDGLSYMEPPYWHHPVRVRLGEVLLASGRTREAIAAFEADLRRFPRNVWSGRGLERASRLTQRTRGER